MTAGADWWCAHMSNITWILFTVWEHKSNNFLSYVKWCFLPHFTFNADFTGFAKFWRKFSCKHFYSTVHHAATRACEVSLNTYFLPDYGQKYSHLLLTVNWRGKKNTDFYLSFNCGLSCITQTILSNPVKWKLHGNKVCLILFLVEKEQRRSEDPCLRYSLSKESDHSELSCLHAQPFAAGRCGCKVHLM